jgi:hypothetical protein
VIYYLIKNNSFHSSNIDFGSRLLFILIAGNVNDVNVEDIGLGVPLGADTRAPVAAV